MDQSKSYYERYWKNQVVLSDFSYKWSKIKLLLPKGNARVLDFGCGKGTIFGEMLKINPGLQIIGADVSEEALKFARKKYPRQNFVKLEEDKKLPFKSRMFDFITALDVLEHIYDTELAFSELARILKPNGKILISVPFNGLLKNLAITLFFFDYVFDPATPHIRFYTKNTMAKYLKKYNLTPIYWNYHGKFYPFSSGMHVIAEKLSSKK